MEEIRESLQAISQSSTLATTPAAAAAKEAVEDKKSSTTDLSAKRNIIDYKSQDEEIKPFREWSWVFENF